MHGGSLAHYWRDISNFHNADLNKNSVFRWDATVHDPRVDLSKMMIDFSIKVSFFSQL